MSILVIDVENILGNKLKLKRCTCKGLMSTWKVLSPTGCSKSAKPRVSSKPTSFRISLPEPMQAAARRECSQGPGVHRVTWIQSKVYTGNDETGH